MPAYAIGDIHGCFNTLIALLDKIHFSPSSDTLITLGDYIDRGPASLKVLDFLSDLAEKYTHHIFLCGNHEDLMIKSILGGNHWFKTWLANGASSTLESITGTPYIEDPASLFTILPHKILNFIFHLRTFAQLEKYFFVHANLCWDAWDILASRETMLWDRNEVIIPSLIQGKTLVHGHTPIPLSIIMHQTTNSKIINIDGGCVYKYSNSELGYLIALQLDTNKVFYQQNIDF